MEIKSEAFENINWLKAYANSNRISWKFLVDQKPIPREYFMNLTEDIIVGFSIEESKLVQVGLSPEFGESSYIRHLSFRTKIGTIKDIDGLIMLCLSYFDFDPEIHIGSWDQISEHDNSIEIKHFIQEMP